MTQEEHEKNTEHCKYIAYCLDCIAKGDAVFEEASGSFLFGEEIPKDADKDEMRCVDMMDYLEGSIYDIEYRIGKSDKGKNEYRSACVMIACGGPTIYVDTHTREAELYRGDDRASYPVSREACEQMDELFEELWWC